MAWKKMIPVTEITDKVTNETVKFAKEFGEHLGTNEMGQGKNGRSCVIREKLTTNQLRKFFGEVKRQQMKGYDVTDFVLLKPKLAYAVGRAKGQDPKIKDFYMVMCASIDIVNNAKDKNLAFKNFIKVFEAIVAYHKATEEGKIEENN